MADKIGVSRETLRNWRKGTSGPSDAALIESAAKFLGLSDWTTLFIEMNGEKEMCNLSEKQIESVKKIYDICVEEIGHFLYIENVRAMLHDYELRKKADPDVSVDDIVSEMANRMFLVVDQEYFYLRGTEIYDELAELTTDIANEVLNTLREYTEEPDQVEEKYDDLSDAAMNMMARLNGIIEKYI